MLIIFPLDYTGKLVANKNLYEEKRNDILHFCSIIKSEDIVLVRRRPGEWHWSREQNRLQTLRRWAGRRRRKVCNLQIRIDDEKNEIKLHIAVFVSRLFQMTSSVPRHCLTSLSQPIWIVAQTSRAHLWQEAAQPCWAPVRNVTPPSLSAATASACRRRWRCGHRPPSWS